MLKMTLKTGCNMDSVLNPLWLDEPACPTSLKRLGVNLRVAITDPHEVTSELGSFMCANT